MIIKLEQNTSQSDIEVLITYPQKNKKVEQLVALINSVDIQITCYSDDEVKLVNASDVFYIESVDKKTIVCCDKNNFFVKERLYQVYEKLLSAGFVQVSKYCILNINKLEKVKMLANSNMEAVLSNGKSLYVTRKYLTDIKRALQEEA
jgi:DNA-binding LytR/AlgR family response regulator